MRPTTRPISCLTLRLALGRADMTAEILGHDHVGGELRPALRNLDVRLLEDDFALLVGDRGGAELPLDGVEGIDAGLREVTCDRETGRLPRPVDRSSLGSRFVQSAALKSVAHRIPPTSRSCLSLLCALPCLSLRPSRPVRWLARGSPRLFCTVLCSASRSRHAEPRPRLEAAATRGLLARTCRKPPSWASEFR